MASEFLNMKNLRELKAEGYITLEMRFNIKGEVINYTFIKPMGTLYIPVIPGEKEDPAQMKTITL